MKFLLLSGDLIVDQLLVSSNDKTRAVDVIKYLKEDFNWKQSIILLGQSTEHVTIEEITDHQLRTILGMIISIRYWKRFIKPKTNIGAILVREYVDDLLNAKGISPIFNQSRT